jgi:uncharacterized lipoprotein YddW (UPF0748 family)
MRMNRIWIATLLLASAGLCPAATYQPWPVDPPPPVREFRAAWIATVANIDWPSRKDLTTAEQKAELIALMDCAARLKLNAVIFQVRPACDALYPSRIEPWSEYLTGAMGKAPEPYYDPLAFAIEEAHKRGLELHAWFNPFRALHNSAKSPVTPTHISRRHPELVRQYGRFLWLDPGESQAQDYSWSVVMDVVSRYDVDGVHFDDYFYPYKERDAAGREVDFPDGASWARLGAHPKLGREDWRRENINQFIQRTYRSIKTAKPWVKFGVSPFGIWRPGNPPQIDGLDAYGKLYADSRRWLASGWIDYFAPQLYWPIESPKQSFPLLLQWWARQNAKDRLLVPGLDITRVRGELKPAEILNQIRLTRRQSSAAGNVHWNLGSLMRNTALAEALSREVYAQPALVPATPWLSRARLPRPSLAGAMSRRTTEAQFAWTLAGKEAVARWLVQSRTRGEWRTEILPASVLGLRFGSPPDVVAVSAVDRYGNASAPAAVRRRD